MCKNIDDLCVRYDWYNGSQLECGNCDPSRTYRTEGWYQCRAVNQFGVAVSNKTHYQTASKSLEHNQTFIHLVKF